MMVQTLRYADFYVGSARASEAKKMANRTHEVTIPRGGRVSTNIQVYIFSIRGVRTYRDSVRKTPVRATFCDRGSLRFQIVGIGRKSIMRSVTMLGTEM